MQAFDYFLLTSLEAVVYAQRTAIRVADAEGFQTRTRGPIRPILPHGAMTYGRGLGNASRYANLANEDKRRYAA